MHNAFSTLLGPILVLWLGALVFYVLDRFLKPQDAGVAETVVLALAMGMLFFSRARMGTAFRFGRVLVRAGWPGSPPFLILDRTSWVLALLMLGTATAASLASLGLSVRGRAGRTASLGATLLLLCAGDWATLALVWVLVDVFSLYALQESADSTGERDPEVAIRRQVAFISLSGAALLGLAITLWHLSGGDTGAAVSPPWPIAGLALIAALLRMLPWPLPSWYDSGVASDRSPHRTPLARVVSYLTPILSGVYLCSRLGAGLQVAQGERWLTLLSVWAGLALLISALRAWGAQEPRQLIEMASPYGVALTLLAVGLGLPGQWQLLVGASAVLHICGLHVGWTQCQYLDITDLRSYWRVAPPGLALFALAGLPLTLGFPARAAIYARVFADERWLVLLLMLAGEAGMLGALLRVLLDVECTLDEDLEQGETRAHRPGKLGSIAPGVAFADLEAWLRNLGYGAGAALALGTVILGAAPGLLGVQGLLFWVSLPRVYVWAALLLPAVGAVVLYRSQETLNAWMAEWWPLVRRALDIQWVLRTAERAGHAVGAVVWSASRIVQGAGYMAWVLLFCLVALLLFGNR
jgi:hypothetical protein